MASVHGDLSISYPKTRIPVNVGAQDTKSTRGSQILVPRPNMTGIPETLLGIILDVYAVFGALERLHMLWPTRDGPGRAQATPPCQERSWATTLNPCHGIEMGQRGYQTRVLNGSPGRNGHSQLASALPQVPVRFLRSLFPDRERAEEPRGHYLT